MNRTFTVWRGMVLALMVLAVVGFCAFTAAESGRFYSVVYDSSGSRDTGIVVTNASERDTSYTLELYDSFVSSLATVTESLAPFESNWHDLTETISELVEGVDWSLAWGLCIVRPLIYATDLLIVSVEVYVEKNLVSVYQVEASHY
jgi:hypothetical protein